MRFQRNSEVEAAPMQAETMLFNPKSNQFCLLNTTAAFVWNHLDAPHTAEQLVSGLCQHFSRISAEQATQDVLSLVDELHKLGMIQSV